MLTFLLLTVVSPAFAHDKEMHKGLNIEGKVLEKTDGSVLLQTEKEKVTVQFSESTKFELGMDGKPGTKSQLNVGDFLMVEGHKMPGKAFGASTVMIHPAEAAAHETH